MIIDFHVHVGKDSSDPLENYSFDNVEKSMEKWGIDKSVVFPFNTDDESLIKESLKILGEAEDRDWIIPFLRFNPRTITKEEFVDLIERGFKGVKLHPRAQDFEPDSEDYFWIYEICQEKDIPILFHSNVSNFNSHPFKIINVARRFPDLKIVMAHFFGGRFKTIEEAKKYPNLYVDTSINSGTMKRMQAVKKHGFDNLVFASDAPYDSQGVSLLKIRESGISNGELGNILGKNAKRILNL